MGNNLINVAINWWSISTKTVVKCVFITKLFYMKSSKISHEFYYLVNHIFHFFLSNLLSYRLFHEKMLLLSIIRETKTNKSYLEFHWHLVWKTLAESSSTQFFNRLLLINLSSINKFIIVAMFVGMVSITSI